MKFFAVTPRGLEAVVADELRALGATDVEAVRAGLRFSGQLELGYQACLWLRAASRVLLELTTFAVAGREALYAGAAAIDWAEHLEPERTFAVDCVATKLPVGEVGGAAPTIDHTSFAALVVKDALVDQLRAKTGRRPSVDRRAPDLRLNLLLDGERASLRLDLSGESLHRRHYRAAGGRAPLKEHVAAGLLELAGWPARAAAGEPLLDPLCGSGTLPIEAALIAGDIAPGLGRERFGLHGWRQHDGALWARLVAAAEERARAGRQRLPPIAGSDVEPGAVRAALQGVSRAGLTGRVHIERRPLSRAAPLRDAPRGLLVANPPYGERLGETRSLIPLYVELGDLLKRRFAGWEACLLLGNAELAPYIRLRAERRFVLHNGAIECRLLCYPITPRAERPHAGAPSGAEAFANRVRKNLRHLGRWARREGVRCYRVYDADIPEYAVAVDRYEDAAVVQEYAPPPTVDAAAARARLRQVVSQLPELLEVAPENVFLKLRRRRSGRGDQPERLEATAHERIVTEGGHRFLVNLADYLDTGLFLDHRPTRALIGTLAAGRRFLNLFGYTATATVYAAKGGARSTTTVDLSASHLAWAGRNLALNGIRLGERHRLIRADVTRWLPRAGERFELIFLDPPTFSTSSAMRGTLDVQRDQLALIGAAARLLADDGLLIFSTNARRFRLDGQGLATQHHLVVEDITRSTIPPDFARRPRPPHATYRLTRRPPAGR